MGPKSNFKNQWEVQVIGGAISGTRAFRYSPSWKRYPRFCQTPMLPNLVLEIIRRKIAVQHRLSDSAQGFQHMSVEARLFMKVWTIDDDVAGPIWFTVIPDIETPMIRNKRKERLVQPPT